jgi:hypothetical protein
LVPCPVHDVHATVHYCMAGVAELPERLSGDA